MGITSSEKEHYHGQDNLKSAAPFFNQSNCIIYALIQSEMEPQTSGPSVRDNAIFKTMWGIRNATSRGSGSPSSSHLVRILSQI